MVEILGAPWCPKSHVTRRNTLDIGRLRKRCYQITWQHRHFGANPDPKYLWGAAWNCVAKDHVIRNSAGPADWTENLPNLPTAK